MKDGEIKNKLSPAQVSVMRHRVTEPPYFGKFWDHYESGTYRCAACNTALFSSADKFDSKTGWPTFRKPLNEKDLQFKSEPGPDDKVEIRCKKCKSHLGYVIANDPAYYRINSVCLTFEALSVAELELPEAEEKEEKKDQPIADRTEEGAAFVSAAATWSVPSLAAGAVAGAVLGVGGALLYCSTTQPAMPETATSTVEIATTTDVGASTSEIIEEATQKEPEATPLETPAVETLTPADAGTPADGTGAATTSQ